MTYICDKPEQRQVIPVLKELTLLLFPLAKERTLVAMSNHVYAAL
ncbi:MAG: hypothetical protein WA667_02890 [Candidatus Nitrosopolaris sp.]